MKITGSNGEEVLHTNKVGNMIDIVQDVEIAERISVTPSFGQDLEI